MSQFKVHRARILLLGERSVFLSYSGTHLMEGNLLIQSTNLNVNFIDEGPHRKVQTKDVRPRGSAKLTHKVNHCKHCNILVFPSGKHRSRTDCNRAVCKHSGYRKCLCKFVIDVRLMYLLVNFEKSQIHNGLELIGTFDHCNIIILS